MRAQRGDTIIEVVLAFAIFSLAAVSTIALINSGLATTQRNLETTLVRQQIDSQAELLRYLRDTRDPAWTSLTTNLVDAPLALSESCQSSPSSIQGAFYIKPPATKVTVDSTTLVTPTTYAKIDYAAGASQSQGIWIQATNAEKTPASTVRAYDFYIHACWESVGVSTPMTLGTIVRIYE